MKMQSEGSVVVFFVLLLALTCGDAHQNAPAYAPGVPPPKMNDGQLNKSNEYYRHPRRPGYSDTLGTMKKCHCMRGVTISDTFFCKMILFEAKKGITVSRVSL